MAKFWSAACVKTAIKTALNAPELLNPNAKFANLVIN